MTNTETYDPQTGELTVVDEAPAIVEKPAVGSVAAQPALPTTPLDKIGAAMASAMKEVGEHPVVKRGENKFHNYKYSRIEDVMEVINDALSNNGIIIFQSEVAQGFLDKGTVVYVTYEFTVFHSSGQVWPKVEKTTGQSRTRDSKGGYDDKSILKCHTQARKAFLMSTFQVKTVDEGKQRGSKPPPEQTPMQQPAPTENKWDDWSARFKTVIDSAKDIDGLERAVKANDARLTALRAEKPDKHRDVMKQVQQRRLELVPDGGGDASQSG